VEPAVGVMPECRGETGRGAWGGGAAGLGGGGRGRGGGGARRAGGGGQEQVLDDVGRLPGPYTTVFGC
jgi:hypothetical protein